MTFLVDYHENWHNTRDKPPEQFLEANQKPQTKGLENCEETRAISTNHGKLNRPSSGFPRQNSASEFLRSHSIDLRTSYNGYNTAISFEREYKRTIAKRLHVSNNNWKHLFNQQKGFLIELQRCQKTNYRVYQNGTRLRKKLGSSSSWGLPSP